MNTINCINSYPTSFQGELSVIGKNLINYNPNNKYPLDIIRTKLLGNTNVKRYLSNTPDNTVLEVIYEPYVTICNANTKCKYPATILSIKFDSGLVHKKIAMLHNNIEAILSYINSLGDLFEMHEMLKGINKTATDSSINNFVKTKMN